jgi:hypothetical protein
MSTDYGLRGVSLLDAAVEQIILHPETWNQDSYRCGGGLCVAGHVDVLAGGDWVEADPDGAWSAYLVPGEGDHEGDVITLPGGVRAIPAGDRAARLVGITRPTAETLFAGDNSRDDIRAIRDQIAAGERS